MDVFVEHLCEHCCVIRVGANGPFPTPFRYSVTFVKRDGYAIGIGFDHKRIARSEADAIGKGINKATGRLMAYDRVGPPPFRMVQINPATIGGRIAMRREAINHPETILSPTEDDMSSTGTPSNFSNLAKGVGTWGLAHWTYIVAVLGGVAVGYALFH